MAWEMDKVSEERIQEIAAEGCKNSPSGKKVAIIGSGPAGLTVAYDLARQGHLVTIFEALEQAGGMMRYGIPEYRLPYDKLDQDIKVIQSMGVEIRCNIRIGQNIKMADLEKDYDATMIAIGLHVGRSTRIPNADHPQVYSAIDLLRRITAKETIEVPKQIVVIGGGNVAFDIARSLARLQRNSYGEVNVAITALESSDKLLADPVEIKEAQEEGLQLFTSRGPRSCIVKDGVLTVYNTSKTCQEIIDDNALATFVAMVIEIPVEDISELTAVVEEKVKMEFDLSDFEDDD